MTYKKIIPVILILFLSVKGYGQTVEFGYDANGGRISRTTIIVQQMKSDKAQLPLINPKSLNASSSEYAKTQQQIDTAAVSEKKALTEDGEIMTFVYPNPNKGIIKINISNMPLESTNEMRLYNLSGTELTVRKNFDSYSEIDISQYGDGIYILRIKINDKIFNWKVIKSSK